MSSERETTYSLRLNSNERVHVHHEDLRLCETICVALRIEGFRTTLSTEKSGLVPAIKSGGPLSAVVASEKVCDDIPLIRRAALGAPVLVVQDEVDLDRAMSHLRRGAIDVVAKPLDIERLLAGVRGALGAKLRPLGGTNFKASQLTKLTARERQVLELILEGLTNKEAAEALEISPRTVDVHRTQVMKKTGARNALDLVRKALG